jgi:hypothetical protein
VHVCVRGQYSVAGYVLLILNIRVAYAYVFPFS